MKTNAAHGEHAASGRNGRRDLRTIGLIGFTPIVLMSALVFFSPTFPYPDDNLHGQVYLDYLFHYHIGEIQSIVTIAYGAAVFLFFVLLIGAYEQRDGTTATLRNVVVGAIGSYLAVWAAVSALTLLMVLIARGYPSFGADPSDLKLITLCWDMLNTFLASGAVPLALTFAAIARANRSCPLLPRKLGEHGAIAVVVANAASLGCAFVYRGPWSPGSTLQFLVPLGATSIWMIATAVVLLRKKEPMPG
ncbi:hypothetical protein ACH427_27860 [Streptomyces sp. NPDC020379]|uniref:hypothetical protein n=1 Tax=Streptomyces sp. NPDC020379 TaxID=3365071 RepID=UPI0037BC9BFB